MTQQNVPQPGEGDNRTVHVGGRDFCSFGVQHSISCVPIDEVCVLIDTCERSPAKPQVGRRRTVQQLQRHPRALLQHHCSSAARLPAFSAA